MKNGDLVLQPLLLIALLLLGVLLLTGCSIGRSEAERVLAAQGYTNIQLTGYQIFACGGDEFNVGFKATGPTGLPVQGVICAGLLKDYTVRIK